MFVRSLYSHRYAFDPETNRVAFVADAEQRDVGEPSGPSPLVLPPFDRSLIEKIFAERRLSTLTITLTERCNMRCRYCVYSGGFADRRSHSSQTLSEENGRKIIDWFAKRSAASPKVELGFYGGEALTAFPTLRNLVAYAEEKLGERLESVPFTTNGAALTAEVAAWIRDVEKIRLSVTLNGPPEIHDRNRVFVDGSPTFAVVETGLRRLAATLGERFGDRVQFLANYSNWAEKLEARRFFRNHPIFNVCHVEFLPIHWPSDSPESEALRRDRPNERKRGELLTLRALESDGDLDFDLLSASRLTLKKLHRRSIGARAWFPAPGLCVPTATRLLTDVEGRLRFCESTDSLFALGNALNDEIYFDKIEALAVGLRRLFNEELRCGACPVRRDCRLCYRHFLEGDEIAPTERIKTRCRDEISLFVRELSVYLSVAERRPEELRKFATTAPRNAWLDAALEEAFARQLQLGASANASR